MTYNVGAGRNNFGVEPTGVLKTIQACAPDILAVQECVDWIDVENRAHNFSDAIAQAGDFGSNFYFGPTLSMRENMQIKKSVMLNALYEDITDWAQGNAVFAKGGFTRLSDPAKPGKPRNVPIYQPPVYEGNRDTDPRYAILARLDHEPHYPFLVNVHLTTLVGERGGEIREIAGKCEEAQMLRLRQAKRLIDLVRPILSPENIIILVGDFNAAPAEASLSTVIEKEGGFSRLIPEKDMATHPKVSGAVDHIFVYPGERVLEYSCWIEDTGLTRTASDHFPVIADIVFK